MFWSVLVLLIKLTSHEHTLIFKSNSPFSLDAINTADRLQQRMPYMSISPSWSHSHSESIVHLFIHCLYALHIWHTMLQAFGWLTAFSCNVLDNIASSLVGHPFHCTKKTLVSHCWSLSFTLRGKRNKRLFSTLPSSYDFLY